MLLEQYKSIKDPAVIILVLGNECEKTKTSQLKKKKKCLFFVLHQFILNAGYYLN